MYVLIKVLIKWESTNAVSFCNVAAQCEAPQGVRTPWSSPTKPLSYLNVNVLVACVGFNIFYTDPLVQCTDPLTFVCSERNTPLIFRPSTHMFYKSEVPIDSGFSKPGKLYRQGSTSWHLHRKHATHQNCMFLSCGTNDTASSVFNRGPTKNGQVLSAHNFCVGQCSHTEMGTTILIAASIFWIFFCLCAHVFFFFWQLQRDTCTGTMILP